MLLPLIVAAAASAQTTQTITEGNAGLTAVEVVFTQATPGNSATTGSYQTVDGTATAADNDYMPVSGTFDIPPGQVSSNPVRILVVGDSKFETDETFRLLVSNVQGGTISNPGPYTFTIRNDDPQPSITVTSPSVTEGNSGVTILSFVVTLGAVTGAPVQASYTTADGTATRGTDYLAANTGVITFPAGETQRTVTVDVLGDTAFEENETMTLTVTSANIAVTGTGTILNDDTRPAAAITIVSGNNQSGRLGARLPQPLIVRVTNAVNEPVAGVTVQWSVTSGAAALNPSSSVTDADGRASTNVNVNSVGVIRIEARAGTLATTFTLNANTSFESRAQGPVAVPIGRALDAICARNESEFRSACTILALTPDEFLTPMIENLGPQQSGVQARMESVLASEVTRGIASRLRSVRAGVERFSVNELQVAVNGRTLPIAMLATVFAQQTATDAGGSEESDYSGWSAFLSGNLGNGERKPGNSVRPFDLESQGVMVGVDRLFGQSIAGASLHVTQMEGNLNEGIGFVDANGYALSLYASRGGLFSRTGGRFDGLHLDGSVTVGNHTYDMKRDLSGTFASALGENDARMFAVAAGTGLDLHTGRTDIDVSLGGMWSRSEIDELSEEGVGPFLLFVEGHEVESLTGTLGLNLRSAFAVPFGTLLPSLRGELVHEFESDARLVTARFLRDQLNNSFTVPVDEPDANYGRVGAGLQALFPYGWSLSIEVNQDVLRDDLEFRNLQFNIYKSF
jgi:uncharacterized protein YhjY with autotransporter beta-barrel domain